jgi:hypothetical protein
MFSHIHLGRKLPEKVMGRFMVWESFPEYQALDAGSLRRAGADVAIATNTSSAMDEDDTVDQDLLVQLGFQDRLPIWRKQCKEIDKKEEPHACKGPIGGRRCQLKNFHARRALAGDITVSLPTTTLAFVKGAS